MSEDDQRQGDKDWLIAVAATLDWRLGSSCWRNLDDRYSLHVSPWSYGSFGLNYINMNTLAQLYIYIELSMEGGKNFVKECKDF